MTKGKADMELHVKQRAINKAAIDALRIDSGMPAALLDKLEDLSEQLFEAADYDFKYGEPEQYLKRTHTLISFLAMVNEIMSFNKGKK